MSSIFAKIVTGEIPCYKVAENENFLAFLDITPIAKGHVLVIPKQEIDYIFDIEDALLAEMIVFSKEVAKKIKNILPCKKIGITVIGLEVPHAHIHLVPMDTLNDMNFAKPKLTFAHSEMEKLANQLYFA